MNCEEVQLQLLMQYDELGAPDGVVGRDCGHAGEQPAEVRTHLAVCEACATLAGKLRRLETVVRSLPEPTAAESTAARLRFESKLDEMFAAAPAAAAAVAGVGARRPRHWWARPRWATAAAAALLLSIGGAAWVHHANESRAVASAGTIEELVDWNLRLAQRDDPAERERLYRESAANLQQKVGSAPLSDDDKRVADALMQDGALLAKNPDPLADADRFSHVADLLVNRMGHAAKRSPRALDQLGESYLLVVDRGIQRNLDRAQAAAAPTTMPATPLSAADAEEHQKRMERIIQRNIQIQKKLENLLEQTSDSARQRPLRKALDATKQHPLNKKQVKRQQEKLEQQQQPQGR